MAERRRQQYQYGSEARDYYEVAPSRKVEEQPIRRPKKHTKQANSAFMVQIVACSLVLFVAAGLYIHQYAVLGSKQKQIRALNEEMRQLKSTISLAQSKKSQKFDTEYIRERAVNELGMSDPLAHQIVYIELPKESYTVYDH